MAVGLFGAAVVVAAPKGLAELSEEPGPLPGGGVGHAPAGRPQSVMRLPQGCCPPDGANSVAWNSRLWGARKYTRRIRPLPIHYWPFAGFAKPNILSDKDLGNYMLTPRDVGSR